MKTTSHPNPTPSGVLGTVAKLIRLTEKENVEWSHWQHPTNNVTARRNLAKYLQRGCPKMGDNGEVVQTRLPEGYELARLILGDDFLTPEEVAIAYGFSYSDEQLEHFANTLPDIRNIFRYRDEGFLLMPRPHREMNLLEVREFDNKLFSPEVEGWYSADNQTFSRDDKVVAGEWLAIRKEAGPNSFSKTGNGQQDLITEDKHVPNAPTASYAVTAYLKVRGIYLLCAQYVRTSSVSVDHHHVIVGYTKIGRLKIDHSDDDCRYGDVGILSALN